MLRNSQHFKLEPLTNGSKTVVLAGKDYSSVSSVKLEVGATIFVKKNKPSGGFDFFIEDNKDSFHSERSFHCFDLQHFILKDWRLFEFFPPMQYMQEPKIKTSILRNHFRQVNRGELLEIKHSPNIKYDVYGSSKIFGNKYPKEALFKMFEGETLMFLGSEMKPLSSEDYHTYAHSLVAKESMWKNTNFLHMNFLIGQRRISYSELDFLHGELFVDSFCYNKGNLYTNKNKKVK